MRDDSERFYFSIRLTPSASRNAIGDWSLINEGQILKVSVTTVPEKGKANKALIALLSKAWGIPKTSFILEKGETDRNKVLSVPKIYESQIPIK